MNHEIKIISLEIDFRGDEYDIFPTADGFCEYRGDTYNFLMAEQYCMIGKKVKPEMAVFDVFCFEEVPGTCHDGAPDWAEECEEYSFYTEIKRKLNQHIDVQRMRSTLHNLLDENDRLFDSDPYNS